MTMWYDSEYSLYEIVIAFIIGYILFAALFIPIIYLAIWLQDGSNS